MAKLTDPTIPDLVTAKGTNVFHTVDVTDTTDDPDGTSFRGNFDQMAQYVNSSIGLIKIVDKAGTFFTSLSTANAYVQSFTLATITNESYNNGVYFFTVPSGSIFRESTQFLQSSDAYIIDELGLITGYGDNAFVNNNGNNVFKSTAFDTYAFNSSTGNNTFGNCSFDDDSFAGSSGNNVFGTITVGNNFLNAAAGVNTIENITLVSSSNTFAGYSTGKFYLNGSIGASTAENYTNFFLSSTASIFVKRENLTNNAGGIEGDLARAKVNGASVFFGEFGTLQDVTDNGFTTTNDIELYGVTDGFKKVTSHANDLDEGTQQVYDAAGNSTIELRGARGFKVHDNAYSGNPLFEVIRDDGVDTDKVVINATTTELTQGTASKLLRLNASKEIVSSSYDESDLLPETAATIGAIVNAATGYTTPLDADKIGIWDTLNGLYKAVTWANIKATLKTYFDTIYATISDLNNKSFTIVMSAGVSSPADSTTYYFGIPTASNAGFTTGVDSRYYYISKTCTVKEVYIHALVGGTIGSNEGVTISVETYNVGSSTPVVTTLITNSLTLDDVDRNNYKVTTGLSIALTAGMVMQIKLLSPVFATNPTLVNFNVYLNCY